MIGFESDEAILQKLRERLRRMTDEELIRFEKSGKGGKNCNHDTQSVRLGKAFTVWFRLALMATLPIPARPRSPYG